jgi:hypothetical protein
MQGSVACEGKLINFFVAPNFPMRVLAHFRGPFFQKCHSFMLQVVSYVAFACVSHVHIQKVTLSPP